MINCIFDDNTNGSIGFYKDLKSGLIKQAKEFIDKGYYEDATETITILDDLKSYDNYNGLLLIHDNNGMGWTCEKYKPEKV